MNRLSIRQIAQILALLVEGNSISGVSRFTYVSETTIASILDKAGVACKRFHDEHVRNLNLSSIQCDEMWSYVYSKSANVDEAKAAPDGAGNAWIWTAVDRHTKLLVAYNVGSRDTTDALKLANDLADRVDSRPQVSTDQHKPYIDAIELAFGSRVDFAQIGKSSEGDDATGRQKRVIAGTPDPEMISTSHVERANLTWRMHNRRLIRRTNGFSKKLSRHEAMMSLFAVHYNFCRAHTSIRTTPAVEAGLDTVVRGRRWLAEMVLEEYGSPGRRGPYRRTTLAGPPDARGKTRGRPRAIREEVKCPECNSNWLPKKGRMGNQQFYKCRSCGYNFSTTLEEPAG